MPKIQTETYAKIPNQYVSIGRSRGLNLLEERVVYMLLNAMQKRYESIKKLEHIDYNFIASDTIKFKDFTETMHIGIKDNVLIHHSIKELSQFGLSIKENHRTAYFVMFKDFTVDEKNLTIEYHFNDKFVTYFTGICSNYFQLSVNEVIGLDSTHALRIYQILKTKLNMTQKTFAFTLDELKKLLNLEGKYQRYSHFKIYVLETSKQRINSSEASQFNIQYTELKTGKKVHSIVFEILPKVKNYYLETGKTPEYAKDLLANQLRELINHEDFNVKKAVSTILDELKKKKPNKPLVNAYLTTVNAIEKTNYKL